MARAEGIDEDEIVRRAVASVPAPDGWAPPETGKRQKKSLLDRVLRR